MPAGKELDSLCSMDARSVVGGDEGWRKGPWSAQEDALLVHHVNLHGEGKWNSVSKLTGAFASPLISGCDRLAHRTCMWWYGFRAEEEREELQVEVGELPAA